MAGATNTGRSRKNNQDSIYFDESIGVGMVADGIGGRKGGEIASSMAINGVRKAMQDLENIREDEIRPFLISAIDKANLSIIARGEHQSELAGMGTTLECLLFFQKNLYLAHIGDSRTYLYSKEHFWQLTLDHNVDNFLERGWLKKSSLQQGWKASALVRAMGLSNHPEIDVYHKVIEPGELYLTASDGLFDMVNDHDIADILANASNDYNALPEILIKEANKRGGRDNITVFIAKIVE